MSVVARTKLLDVTNLSHRLGERSLFDKLSFGLNKGEHLVIVGGSGSGKSTLITLIAEQRSSQIKYLNSSNSSLVLQEGALLDYLTVMQNMQLVARQNRLDLNRDHIAGLLKLLNIDDSLHSQNVSNLSGGQMRRVAVARALLSQPEIVLFDEPDAGLDLSNLSSLSELIKSLISAGKACITVSHNPIFIAQCATRVCRLEGEQLIEIASWAKAASSQEEALQRQNELQLMLMDSSQQHSVARVNKSRRSGQLLSWCQGLKTLTTSIFATKYNAYSFAQLRDSFSSFWRVYSMAFITGAVFFALVGLMLGATTMAVVKLLSDHSLKGFIAWFINPQDLLEMLGGRFALYLAPAVGGMLFAARSGSLVASWLGQLNASKQIRALENLNVPVVRYLYLPSLLAIFVGGVCASVLFAAAIWGGGTIAAEQFFGLEQASLVLQIHERDIVQSQFWMKSTVYSAVTAITIMAFACVNKASSVDVNAHTTSSIVYSTVLVAFAELAIILF